MRMRVETPEGVLVIYDAASPPQVGEGCSGYLAYWLSTPDMTPYVFPAVLHEQGDLVTPLLALERDLGVDLEALADSDDRVDAARSASAEPPNGEIVWGPATLRRAVEIMGFDPGDDSNLPEPDDGQNAIACGPCMASLGPPSNCGSPGGLGREALNVAAGCCGGGGCIGPCCSDPWCCGDLCCRHPAACDGPYCAGDDMDCDGTPNDQDPDIDGDGKANNVDDDMDGDGVGNDLDPDRDGTPNWDDPTPGGCNGPCCGSSDPCCGHDDPCDPVCGDLCSPDCVDCDDGDDCTTDTCHQGDCDHTCPVGVVADGGDCGGGREFSVTLLSITFKNNIWLDWDDSGSGSGWGVASAFDNGPDWKASTSLSRPVAYVRGRNMTLNVKVKVTGDGAAGSGLLKVSGPDGLAGNIPLGSVCGEKTLGLVQINTETLTLPNAVRAYEPMTLTWTARAPGGSEDITIGTTLHNVYLTCAGSQIGNPTPKRVSTVCNWASGENTSDGIAMKVYNWLGTHDPPHFDLLRDFDMANGNPWALMPGGGIAGSNCRGLAKLMQYACGVVGVPAWSLTRMQRRTTTISRQARGPRNTGTCGTPKAFFSGIGSGSQRRDGTSTRPRAWSTITTMASRWRRMQLRSL